MCLKYVCVLNVSSMRLACFSTLCRLCLNVSCVSIQSDDESPATSEQDLDDDDASSAELANPKKRRRRRGSKKRVAANKVCF